MKIAAHHVIKLLREKHFGDVFVEECKTGASQNAEFLRMDAWAMVKSWANPRVIAYEVKVGRGDFMADNKWRSYLRYCNEFSFVCPRDLIRMDELPDEVGLIYVASTGNRLFTKRKAVWRDVPIPEDLWRYILMCRAVIGNEYSSGVRDKKAEWLAYLDEKKTYKDLGYRVAKRIREHVSQVECENMRLSQVNKSLQEVKETMERLGIDGRTWDVQRRLRELKDAVPRDLIEILDHAKRGLGDAISKLTEINAAEKARQQ